VRNFVHPVLALEKSISGVVPIDLLLPGPVLVISGPNAGGKTLALKSFGLAACFVKLGIPITVNQIPSEESEARVDFFENIFVQIGDSQDLLLGESTLMAWLNSCSKLILRMETTKIGGTLALLDELVSLCLFRTINSVYYDFTSSQIPIHYRRVVERIHTLVLQFHGQY
jgi:DNA mismatch repair protein MutS2